MGKDIGSILGRPRGLTRKVVLLVLALSLLWSSAASANLFIKFAGIEGESTARGHEDWSEINYVSWAVYVTAGGLPEFQDLHWSQDLDSSIPPLLDTIGRRIDEAWVDLTTVVAGNELTYFQMYFRDVSLTGLSISGTPDTCAEVIGDFAYGWIMMTYHQINPDGTLGPPISADYDLSSGSRELGGLVALYGQGLSGPSVVPIPAPIWLLGSGLLGLGAWRRFKKT